jgi:hypothetical protein
MKTVWMNTLAWVGVVLGALVLAFATPQERSVMGRLPFFTSPQATQSSPLSAAVPALGSGRTLALVTFSKDHRKEADSWVQGLQLRNDPAINWVRIPVLKDPGDSVGRRTAENRVRANYAATTTNQKQVVPVFADKAAFAQSAGLADTAQAYAVVINADGEVLARVAGEFDETKAEALMETLKGADSF